MEWYYAENDEQRGPISEDVLVDLVEQGVIHADTLVWNDSMSDWRTYGEVHAEQSPPHVEPTVITGSSLEERTEPLAIASLALAIISLGCGFILSIAAVVCGHIALSRINAAEGRLAGRPLAIAGLVIGYITLTLNILSTIAVIIGFFL